MTSSPEPRILLLEDEPLVALELQEALEALGLTVIGPAATCEAALELIWSTDVDAAVLDLILGEGTCEVVANELSLSGIPWAFASGYDTHELHDRFPDAPIIEKPSRSEKVAAVLKTLLNRPRDTDHGLG